MIEADDSPESDQAPRAYQETTQLANEPIGGYEPHPLFPVEGYLREVRDIQFITFRRRRSDGRSDNLPEDIPAGELVSWAEVIKQWGGGEYKAIGKDKKHRVVAWYPEKNGEWMQFDLESKPFTLRAQRHLNSLHIDGRGAAGPAPVAAAAPPAPLAPPAPHPLEATMVEVLRELRARQAPTIADPMVVEMIKAQSELMRAVLVAVLAPRPVKAYPRPTSDPTVMALQLLTAMREWPPKPQAHVSCTDRLGESRATRESTTPLAPPPPQAEFSEIKDLMMSVMQADALSKGTRDLTPPPAPERPPPPQQQLHHVPGVGMVEVVQPETPSPHYDERDLVLAALLRDPTQRQLVFKALGLDVLTIRDWMLKPTPQARSSKARLGAHQGLAVSSRRALRVRRKRP